MDFSVIFQLRTKRFWWMDVIFYFVISLLVATVLSYGIFLIKNNWQRQDLKTETLKFANVGTDEQRKQESDVLNYQKKINDFNGIFKNHEFASNVFAFMQTQTIPNVWFKQFSLDEKGGTVQLSGESDNLDALSRQVSVLEKNKYVTNVGNLNSSLGDSAKIQFNVSITLNPSIFNYLSDMTPILEASAAPAQPQVPTTSGAPTTSKTPATNPAAPATQSGAGAAATTPASGQQSVAALSQEKLITSFHFLLKPEVIGIVDENNFTVSLNVPFGTDVKLLTPSIDFSPGATILPDPNMPQNFTNPVTYTVVAQDGTSQDYKVTVNVLPENAKKPAKSGPNILVIIVLIIIVFAAIAAAALFIIRRRNKAKGSY